MRVAPVVGILSIAEPVIGDAHPAGEPYHAVDNQQLPMRPIVEAAKVVPPEGVIFHHLDACPLHLLEHRIVHPARADPVQQDMDLDPRLGAQGKRRSERLADRAGPVDVGLEGDRPLCRTDGLQHGWEDLVTVAKGRHPVAGHDSRAEKRAHGTNELRVAHSVKVLDLVLDLLLAGREIGDQQHQECTSSEGNENPHGRGLLRNGAVLGNDASLSCREQGSAPAGEVAE